MAGKGKIKPFLESQRQRFEYPFDGHWNALGHEIVYDALIRSDLLARFKRGF